MNMTLVVCPLKKELSYLIEGFSKLKIRFEVETNHKLVTHKNHELGIILAVGGHGKTQFGIQTQYLIHHHPEVQSIIATGAAGGLDPDLSIGDLLVGEQIIEHDFKESFNPHRKKPIFITSPELVSKAKKVAETASKFKVHFGAIASGDEDIINPARATELILETQAKAVAWEGSGGARAAAFNSLPYLEIRTITDNARDSVSESFLKNLQPCMHNAAFVIKQILST